MIHEDTETSIDANQYCRLNEDEVAQLVDNLCTAMAAIAGNDTDAFAILAEAAVTYFADNLYEGDRDRDTGFILATIEGLFVEQADFHDELGLYMGEYIVDQPSDDCPVDCRVCHSVRDPDEDIDDCVDDYGDGFEDDSEDDPDEIINSDPSVCSCDIPEREECLGCPRCPDCPGSIRRYVVDGSDIRIVMVRRG